MNLKRKFLALSLILFSSFHLGCDEDNKVNCDFGVCTMEFRSIAVSLKHASDNTAFLLTDYKVIRVSDNKDITISNNNINDNNGFYQITNDTNRDLFKFKNIEVEFNGYLNDILVLQKRFVITADCCHISLVSGETEFFL